MTESSKKTEAKPDRGLVRIDGEECKGCGLCVEACPLHHLSLGDVLNHYGYRTALYAGSGCTACGVCFMACPEPGAITVLRLASNAAFQLSPKQGDSSCASS